MAQAVTHRYLKELRPTLVLAFPIASGHLSQMLMGFADTLMIGRVGVVPLAAAAFANTLVHFVFVIGIGLLSSVAVLGSHAHGAGDRRETGEVLRRGVAIGLGSGLLMFALLWGSFPLLGLLRQPPEVVAASLNYLWLISASLPLMMLIVAFRNFSEAQNVPWPAFWAGLVSVGLNVFLNWVLIYGNLGSPAYGLDGAGMATLASRVFNLVLLVAWLRLDARVRPGWPARWLARMAWKPVAAMLRLGFPVGLQIFMEVAAFSGTTLLMGWLGIIEIAAHQIAITCAATTFMVPLGVSLAVAIRVGQVIGAGEPWRARPIGFGAIGLAALLSGVFAALFILFNRPLAGLFTADPATLALAARLIVVAGLFQFFDGVQVVSIGALRGAKDVRRPTAIVFAAYWIVAIPCGAALAFATPMGATGLWAGLALGLACAAAGLAGRFAWLTRGG